MQQCGNKEKKTAFFYDDGGAFFFEPFLLYFGFKKNRKTNRTLHFQHIQIHSFAR